MMPLSFDSQDFCDSLFGYLLSGFHALTYSLLQPSDPDEVCDELRRSDDHVDEALGFELLGHGNAVVRRQERHHRQRVGKMTHFAQQVEDTRRLVHLVRRRGEGRLHWNRSEQAERGDLEKEGAKVGR